MAMSKKNTNSQTMASLDERIQALESNIKTDRIALNAAATTEEKSEIRLLIIESTRTLNLLLLERQQGILAFLLMNSSHTHCDSYYFSCLIAYWF